MNKLVVLCLLIGSLLFAWFAVWNHYNIILQAKSVKPTKWRGDDTIFLLSALVLFIMFVVAYFMS